MLLRKSYSILVAGTSADFHMSIFHMDIDSVCLYTHIALESIAMPTLKISYTAEDPLHQHIILLCLRCREGEVTYARKCSSTGKQGPFALTVGSAPEGLLRAMGGRPT